jgi:hypothetical protein
VRSLKACEEFLAHAVGLGLEPRAHVRPDGFEGILSGPPISRRPGHGEMGGADLALLPRRGQALEKAVEGARVARRQVGWLARGEGRQVLLHGADLLQQP